ncbi:MAG: hypothetical protein AAGF35_13540 [Pseudomonadota bacterium]
MTERPIPLYQHEVLAILDGRQSQLRRVVKDPFALGCPTGDCGHWEQAACDEFLSEHCPYGRRGDKLWAKETCRAYELQDNVCIHRYWDRCPDPESLQHGLDGVVYGAGDYFRPIENTRKASEAWADLFLYGGKRGGVVPSIHMPRWASRILLEVKDVRVERVQEISEEDAIAEGVGVPTQYVAAFRVLWNSIHGDDAWERNDWVRVIEFEVVR